MTATPAFDSHADAIASEKRKSRRAIRRVDPGVFTEIYQEEANMVIWERALSATLQASVREFLDLKPTFQSSVTVTPQSALTSVSEALGESASPELSEDIAELVDMFCCLFDLGRAGLRMTALDSAMCPKFHVDRVPCRLVTTYLGVATEWLAHQHVDRSKLGAGSNGLPDCQSGIFQNPGDVQQLMSGEVALLKGELWEGNENAGLVHRSPAVDTGTRRLLLTLDFIQ